ncbi:MAG: hypothetical protein ABL900_09575 [Burkholderiaceae bacterium]
MTLREQLHRQLDEFDAVQLSIADLLLQQVSRPSAPLEPKQADQAIPPYLRARQIAIGQGDLGEEVIEGREERL